jgi:hypothetical protein
LVVGSANLTASALHVGAETLCVQQWEAPLTDHEQGLLAGADDFRAWFDHVWARSTPAATLLATYHQRFNDETRPGATTEEETDVTLQVIEPTSVVGPDDVALLATADAFWIETRTLYANRGPGNPGNQLDGPRGMRVFFGFSSADVPPNHQFGVVVLHVPGHNPVDRGIRFGTNHMDKINLPTPGVDGPSFYDDSYLLFERAGTQGGTPLFRLTAINHQDLLVRKNAATRHFDFVMQGGRSYGVLYD